MIKQIDRNSRKRRSRVIGSTRHLAKLCAQSAMAATMVLALENVAVADPLAFVAPSHHQSTIFDRIFRDQGRGPDTTKDTGIPANVAGGHRGQVVSYATGEAPGTVRHRYAERLPVFHRRRRQGS